MTSLSYFSAFIFRFFQALQFVENVFGSVPDFPLINYTFGKVNTLQVNNKDNRTTSKNVFQVSLQLL